MSNVRTVSDTKRSFYTLHTRPISSIYRRVVEELMVEMHLLSVNVDFSYDVVYSLGVVTAFNRFMQGYRPEQDRDSIFNSLCRAIESDAQQYHHDAEQLENEIRGFSKDSIQAIVALDSSAPDGQLKDLFHSIAQNPSFKYSRLFAIGIYTILETVDPDVVSDKKTLDAMLETLSSTLKLPGEKIIKDLELYQSNLEKLVQAQIVLNDMLIADRKKREQREQEKAKELEQSSNGNDELPESAGSSID